MTRANSPARPVGSAGLACLSESALADSKSRLALGRALMEEVAWTTRVLMEAMADLNFLPAAVLSVDEDCGVKVAAVASGEQHRSLMHDSDKDESLFVGKFDVLMIAVYFRTSV